MWFGCGLRTCDKLAKKTCPSFPWHCLLILFEDLKAETGESIRSAVGVMVSEMISTRTLQSPSQEQMAIAHYLLNATPGVGCSEVTVLK